MGNFWRFGAFLVAAALQFSPVAAQIAPGGGGSGSGTVTTVSVATANGVSGTVANPTTTPAITIALGAITPTTVAIGAGSAITSSGSGGALVASAYTDTTNGSNISTGTVAAARGGAGTINGALAANGSGVVSQSASTGLSDVVTDTAWTPSDASGATLTFTSVTARYTKVGKMVMASFRLTFPTTASAAVVAIGGLPVAASANYPASAVASGSCFSGAATNPDYIVLLVGSATQFNLINNAAAAPTNVTLTAAILSCTVTYISS